jgi:hypothetical protein
MKLNPRPIRIEPAFVDREQIRAMFERYAPYRAVAAYAPEGVTDETGEEAKRPVLPWFRGNWAVGGKPLVDGAEAILGNKSFLEAARAAFGTPRVCPEMVVVNINAPMPASPTHMDNPSFYGATREDYPLPFLRVMGNSGLFEPWRVVRASTLSWFYKARAATLITGRKGSMVQCGASSHPLEIPLSARTLTGYTIASAPSAIPMQRYRVCQRLHTLSRMAMTTGQFWRTEKSAAVIQVTRFGCPFSGRRKFGTGS